MPVRLWRLTFVRMTGRCRHDGTLKDGPLKVGLAELNSAL